MAYGRVNGMVQSPVNKLVNGRGAVLANILAVDDEQDILKMIQRILSRDGHNVDIISNPEIISSTNLECYDIILLDVMMPQTDGFTLCQQVRRRTGCPVVFLTAKSDEESLVYGLGMGADDYILKPFGTNELRARVNAHLRRENRGNFTKISSGKAEFNITAKQLLVDGSPVPLTKGEYYICEFLARNRGQVFSKEQIYEKVFGFDGTGNDNTITTHIKNIRMKLERLDFSPVKTVWGIGYKWEI